MTVKTAVVVEGGAMRGIFSAGVLDVMLEQGLEADLAIGTSAGAANLASFVAKQHQRNLRSYVDIMTRKELFSLSRALRGGHYMDLDWLWDRFAAENPLDEAAIARARTQLVSVATCADTGDALYFEHRPPNVHVEVKAGCTLPVLYRGPIRLQGRAVVDGGISDPIPAGEAYRRGARRLIVIRSRPIDAVKETGRLDPLLSRLLGRNPGVAKAMREGAQRYRASVEYLRRPPADAELIQLAPPAPLKTTRTSQDRAVLEADYALGRRIAEATLPTLKRMLRDDA